MKTCCAGHSTVEFSVSRCPVCENIDRLDKELLKADVEIEELKKRINKLTNAQVSNFDPRVERLKEMLPKEPYTEEELKKLDWNGGAC